MSGPLVIIEDDPDILDLLIDLLADQGIEAIAVPPQPADMRALPLRPAVALIDLMLPGTSGIDVARKIRAMYPDVPLLAMSASRLMLEVAMGSGMFDAHVAKPFDLSLLLEAVQAAMAVSRQAPTAAAS